MARAEPEAMESGAREIAAGIASSEQAKRHRTAEPAGGKGVGHDSCRTPPTLSRNRTLVVEASPSGAATHLDVLAAGDPAEAASVKLADVCEDDRLRRHVEAGRERLGREQHLRGTEGGSTVGGKRSRNAPQSASRAATRASAGRRDANSAAVEICAEEEAVGRDGAHEAERKPERGVGEIDQPVLHSNDSAARSRVSCVASTSGHFRPPAHALPSRRSPSTALPRASLLPDAVPSTCLEEAFREENLDELFDEREEACAFGAGKKVQRGRKVPREQTQGETPAERSRPIERWARDALGRGRASVASAGRGGGTTLRAHQSGARQSRA